MPREYGPVGHEKGHHLVICCAWKPGEFEQFSFGFFRKILEGITEFSKAGNEERPFLDDFAKWQDIFCCESTVATFWGFADLKKGKNMDYIWR